MTDERMALLELIEKGADADLVRELLAFASERLMAAEVDQLTGAAAGVRSPDRLNHRNGYRERGWETRVGPGLFGSGHKRSVKAGSAAEGPAGRLTC